jgi:hypothetical protein
MNNSNNDMWSFMAQLKTQYQIDAHEPQSQQLNKVVKKCLKEREKKP